MYWQFLRTVGARKFKKFDEIKFKKFYEISIFIECFFHNVIDIYTNREECPHGNYFPAIELWGQLRARSDDFWDLSHTERERIE